MRAFATATTAFTSCFVVAPRPEQAQHIYRELGLQFGNKPPKRRVTVKLRHDRNRGTRSNETWAMARL